MSSTTDGVSRAATILVVGASGQLGSAFVRLAKATGRRVRAVVRQKASFDRLAAMGAEPCYADLRDPASLARACSGVEAVASTATVIFPRGRYSFDVDEGVGYQNLVKACSENGVKRLSFVSVSIPFTKDFVENVPTVRLKRRCEDLIRSSGVDYTILRASPFMDDYFALIGSALPLRGEDEATLDRATGVTRILRSVTGRTIEQFGFATVPGPTTARHSFIALRNVAAYLLSTLDHPAARNAVLDVGGPEALSWRDVCDIYSAVLDRPVRPFSAPARLLKALARTTRPFSEALANQLGVLWILAAAEMAFDSRAVADQFGIVLTTAREYLEEKASLLPGHPSGVQAVG